MRKSLFVFLAPYSLIAMEFPQPTPSQSVHAQANSEQRIVFLEKSIRSFGELLITQQKSLADLTETMVEQSKTHQELTAEIRRIMTPLKRGRKPKAEVEQACKDAQDEILKKVKTVTKELLEDQKKVLAAMLNPRESTMHASEALQENHAYLGQMQDYLERQAAQLKKIDEFLALESKRLQKYEGDNQIMADTIKLLLDKVTELKKTYETDSHGGSIDQQQMRALQTKLDQVCTDVRQLREANNIFI